MTNLAAAVEAMRELTGFLHITESRDPMLCAQATLDFEIHAKNWVKQHGETILAELGRLSSAEPFAWWKQVELADTGEWVTAYKDEKPTERETGWEPLFTRPPVAGLAELTDSQLAGLLHAMSDAGMKFWQDKKVITTVSPEYESAVAKAAREFLGKVE